MTLPNRGRHHGERRGDLEARKRRTRALVGFSSLCVANDGFPGWRDRPGRGSRAARRTDRDRRQLNGTAISTGAGVSMLAGEIMPSHLHEAGPAISTIKQVQKRKHDPTSLLTNEAMLHLRPFPAAFAAKRKRFRRRRKWFRRNGCGDGGLVENSGRAVDSCAASACARERIPVRRLVDMLRINACEGSRGSRSRRSHRWCRRFDGA